jgi:polar amino acid transport system ATP-binding protein
MTMVLATHEMTFARDVADAVCFLEDGRIVEQGPPHEILSAPKQPETQRFLARLIGS